MSQEPKSITSNMYRVICCGCYGDQLSAVLNINDVFGPVCNSDFKTLFITLLLYSVLDARTTFL